MAPSMERSCSSKKSCLGKTVSSSEAEQSGGEARVRGSLSLVKGERAKEANVSDSEQSGQQQAKGNSGEQQHQHREQVISQLVQWWCGQLNCAQTTAPKDRKQHGTLPMPPAGSSLGVRANSSRQVPVRAPSSSVASPNRQQCASGLSQIAPAHTAPKASWILRTIMSGGGPKQAYGQTFLPPPRGRRDWSGLSEAEDGPTVQCEQFGAEQYPREDDELEQDLVDGDVFALDRHWRRSDDVRQGNSPGSTSAEPISSP